MKRRLRRLLRAVQRASVLECASRLALLFLVLLVGYYPALAADSNTVLRTPSPSPGLSAIPGATLHPFTLLRGGTSWRPDRPEPGGPEDALSFALILLMPVCSAASLLIFALRTRRSGSRPRWGLLLLGNALVLTLLLTMAFALAETYFRFFYDTTDAVAYTRVCDRWVQRHWHLNSANCRDNLEYAPRIQPGKRRITFIGDSFAAGHGIKNVEDRFENRLRQAHPDWEVHVMARVGFDTGDELNALRKALAKGYEIDQVVLVYCLNDVADLMPEREAATARIFDEYQRSGWFARNSYFVNLLYHRFKVRHDRYLGDYSYFVREGYRGTLWQRQKERLQAFRDLVLGHGGKMAVVTFPFLHALGPDYEYRLAHEELDSLWRELGVPHLDLLQAYSGLSPRALAVNAYDPHPNEYAHQLAAAALGPFLSAALNEPREK